MVFLKHLCLALGCFAISVHADTVLSLGRTTGSPGTAIDTQIALASDDALVGLQIDFGYDPLLVDPGTPAIGGDLFSSFKVASSIIESGRMRIVLYSEDNNILRNGNVISIPLSVTGEIPQGTPGLQVLEVQLADLKGLNRTYALAPFIDLINPEEADQFPLGEQVNVEVEAYAAVGNLQSVQLFVDGDLTATATSAPYSFSFTPGERGTHDLLVVATDAGTIQSEDRKAIYILSGFDDWLAGHLSQTQLINPFVGGIDSDPDGDGLRNLIEYLDNSSPLIPEDNRPLNTELMEIGGIIYLSLTLHMPTEMDDVDYSVYATSQLDRAEGDPPDAAVLVSEENDTVQGITTRVYRDPQPASDSARFMYVEASIRP